MKKSMEATKSKYKIASISSRFFTRLFDLILLAVVSMLFNLILLNIDRLPKLFNHPHDFEMRQWQIYLTPFINAFFAFMYFVILPYKWKGRTLTSKLFKVRIVGFTKEEVSIKQLMKREIFNLWLPLFVMTLIAFIMPNTIRDMVNRKTPSILDYIVHKKEHESDANILIARLLMGGTAVIFLINLFTIVISQERTGAHDIYSDSIPVSSIPMKPPVPKVIVKPRMPGVLVEETQEFGGI